MISHRTQKLITASDLGPELAEIEVKWLAVGGVSLTNKPLSLLELFLASRAGALSYSSLSGCAIDVDFAVAFGPVAETFVPVALFQGTKTWPNYRAAAETGSIQAHTVDVATVMAGYFASAEGVPFHPVTAIAGSDVSDCNPLLEFIEDPRFGKVGIVRPIVPDICLIHAQRADSEGNAVVHGGTSASERMLARASRRVIVSCDELVPVGGILYGSEPAVIPGMYVDRVCHIPSGAWPTASPGLYRADAVYVRTYWQRAEDGRKSGDPEAMRSAATRLAEDLREVRKDGGRRA